MASCPAALAEGFEPGSDLRGYEPSYLVYAFDEENHVEFKISIQYPVKEVLGRRVARLTGGTNELFFAYTGMYDFFVFSEELAGRDSAPVVSRLQNPGMFVKNTRPLVNGEGLESISIGWFHESNGQQISDNSTFVNTVNAEDFVSRGWDYLGIDFNYKDRDAMFMDGDVSFYLRLRFFCDCQGFGFIDGKEDDIRIFGGTETAEISDYDGLRFIIDNYANHKLHYGLHLRSGTSDMDALKRLSYQFEVTYRISNVPIKLFYFKGYGKDISTYHIKDEYIGLGFGFW